MTNTINNVPRELLERVLNAGWGSETVNALDDLRDFLESAPSPAGVDGEHEAQPEVAENTGSRSMANKLQSQGCTGRTEVDGVAAPDEASDAVDIYAWSTFDGEGGYDLRMYENNETYQAEWLALNGEKYSGWVKPLCRLSDAQTIIDGLRWEADQQEDAANQWRELALQFDRHRMTAMAHIRAAASGDKSAIEALGVFAALPPIPGHEITAERDQLAQRIGELEGLLREVHDTYRAAIHWEDLRGTMKRIDAALSAGKDSAS